MLSPAQDLIDRPTISGKGNKFTDEHKVFTWDQ